MNTNWQKNEKNKIRPLIKWTGGKYDEFEEFSQFIPPYKNYYEPFFGGGGVFFALHPPTHSFLNDKSTSLIHFYELIKSGSELFCKESFTYADAWDAATNLGKHLSALFMPLFTDFIDDKMEKKTLLAKIILSVEQIDQKKYYPLFDKNFIVQVEVFKKMLSHSICDKFNRIKNIQLKENKHFTTNELHQHIETGVKSGLYLFLRSLSNDVAKERQSISKEKAAANWYFVREFCYASMFRFNRNGEFNIPYGGIAYNKKNFRQKVELIFSDYIKGLFGKASFSNLDFADFLNQFSPTKDDFVFLDPPYDSEFSEYDHNVFTKNDQIRLRDAILKCKGKCMVVIKETEFIKELYNHLKFSIIDFDKMYTYNVRGRNNRGTKHLIILNYKISLAR